MKTTRSIAISLIMGVVTAVVLGVATPFMLLSELGGPTNFATPILFIALLGLALAAFASRPKGAIAGVVCGIIFSLPVVIVCCLIRHSDPTVLREHGGQLLFAGLATVAISVIAMAGLGGARKTSPRTEEQNQPTNK
jgi:hypothetical protein